MNWLLRRLGLVRYKLVLAAVDEIDEDQRTEAKRIDVVRLTPVPSCWAVMTYIDRRTGRNLLGARNRP